MAAEDQPFSAQVLDRVRDRIEAGDLDTAAGRVEFGELDEQVAIALERQLQAVDAAVIEVGDGELGTALEVAREALEVYSAFSHQVMDLGRHWLGSAEARPLALASLRESVNRYERIVGQLEAVVPPELAEEWSRASSSAAQIGAAAAQVLAGLPGPLEGGQVDAAPRGDVVGEALRLNALMSALPVLACEVLDRAAVDLSGEAEGAAERTVVLAGFSFLVALAAAWWIGRSVATPLRRLTDRARLVGAGNLTGEPLLVSGPPEIAVASAAFNDVVANLALLERKAHALAECDFDAPVLASPLPGPLGQELQRSVRLLSGSIIERDGRQTRLAYQATHDPLTGIANRAEALSKLEAALARARRAGDVLAVVFIDLENFKGANDAHGHAVGDAVLRVVARAWRRRFAPVTSSPAWAATSSS